MKTIARRTIVDTVLDQYVVWGGPVVTRREAMADCKAKGFDARAIDTLVFGRREALAPADPRAEVEFLRQIQALDW